MEKSNIFSCGINYLPYFADDVQDLGQSVCGHVYSQIRKFGIAEQDDDKASNI